MVKFISMTGYNTHYGADVERLMNALMQQFNGLSNVTFLDMQLVAMGTILSGVIVYRENPVQEQKDEEVKKPWIGMQGTAEPSTQNTKVAEDWFKYTS